MLNSCPCWSDAGEEDVGGTLIKNLCIFTSHIDLYGHERLKVLARLIMVPGLHSVFIQSVD